MLVWIIILGAVGYLVYKIAEAVRTAKEVQKAQQADREKMLATCKPIGDGMFKAREKGTGKWAVLNAQREVLTPFRYENVFRFIHGYVIVTHDFLYGAVDHTGREVIPCRYDTFYPFRETGLAWVKKDRKWGMISRTGELVVPLQWDMVDLLGDSGYDMVRLGNRRGLVDDSGKVLFPAVFETLYPDHRGFVKAQKDGLWGVLSVLGEEIIPIRFSRLKNFTGTRFWVEEKGLWGMWNLETGMLHPCCWEEVDPGSTIVSYVKKDGRYAMIDETGAFRTDYLWTAVDFDYSGLRDHQRVAIGDLWAKVYGDGTFVWEAPDRFENGIARTQLEGKPVFVKTDGALCPET